MTNNNAQLKQAIQFALNDDWDASHKIAQDFSNHYANWIHAVLHKIEGDEWNSKYWYQRTNGRRYEDYTNPKEELLAILDTL
jgi:hypothetical protein